MSKKSQIPRQAFSKSALPKVDKHTYSTCYSITIRTGYGISLGSYSVDSIIQAFTLEFPDVHASILTIEKADLEAHFQGGIFYSSPKRQDKLRDYFLPHVINLFKEQNPHHTSKQLESVSKYALKIVPHHSFPILFSYCTKEIDGDWSRIIVENPGPWAFHELAPHLYCKHNYPFWTYCFSSDSYSCQCKFSCYPPTGIKNFTPFSKIRV